MQFLNKIYKPYQNGLVQLDRKVDNVIDRYDRIQNRIYAEYYDEGGEGKGYSDKEQFNTGYGFRGKNSGVDTYIKGDNIIVGNFQPNEWLSYSIDVRTAGKYKLNLRFAKYKNISGTIDLYIDGTEVTPKFSPTYSSSNTWALKEELHTKEFYLSAGKHVINIKNTTSFNDDWINLDFLEFQYVGTFKNGGEENTIAAVDSIISKKENLLFEVYPNPSADVVTLVLPINDNGYDLQVMDVSGKMIHQSQIMGGQQNLDFALELSNGIYFVRAINLDEQMHEGMLHLYIKKLVIRK